MANTKLSFLVRILAIFLLAIATNGCSILAKAIRGGSQPASKPSGTEVPANSSTASPSQPEPAPRTFSSRRAETNSEQPQTKAGALRRMNCREASQTDYIYGTYQIGWTAAGNRYEGILKMKGESGAMRIQYFNTATNAKDMVDQMMVLASCPQGLLFVGLNPVTSNTNNPHPTYSADNILVRRETNGTTTLLLIDDQGVVSPVEIKQVSN